jgi:hypothetical protein
VPSIEKIPGNDVVKWMPNNIPKFSDDEVKRQMRAVEHAIAQQRLEELTVSEATNEDMRRAARGEISDEDVIGKILARHALSTDSSEKK